MNFTLESLAIVLIFIGMAFFSFFMSLPNILKHLKTKGDKSS